MPRMLLKVRIGSMVEVIEEKRKICLIGDWGVGKTSLIRKFVLDQFDDSYLATFGTKATKKRMKFKKDNNTIYDLILMIWDVMGQQEFKNIRTHAYQGTHGALIVCDITRKETLYNLGLWQTELFSIAPEIPLIILANKIDLRDKAEVTPEELKKVATQLKAPFFVTSAKTGRNVQNAFLKLGNRLVNEVPK